MTVLRQIVMALTAAAMVAGCPAEQRPTTTPVGPDVLASADATDHSQALVWQFVRDFPDPQKSFINDLAAGGSGFVAVGQAFEPADPLEPAPPGAIWISDEGEKWRRLPHQESFRAAIFQAITPFRGGFAVVGSVLTRLGGSAVWLSADGVSWRRVLIGQGLFFADVAAHGTELVAVGTLPVDDPEGPPTRAAIWRSGDGEHWVEVKAHPAASDLERVVVARNMLLAFGRLFDPAGRGESHVVWRSDDGTSWEEVLRLGPDEGIPNAATATDRRVIALGMASAPMNAGLVGAVWVSPDGKRWARLPADSSLAKTALWEVLVRGGLLIGVGTIHGARDEQVPSTWISHDGVLWDKGQDLEPARSVFIRGAAVHGDRVVIAGSESADPLTGQGGGTRIWVATIR